MLYFDYSKVYLLAKNCVQTYLILIKEIYLSNAHTCMNFYLFKQKCFLIKETNTFGHIVDEHIDHFTPHHTAFEQSTACLSVLIESLPGLIPFAIL